MIRREKLLSVLSTSIQNYADQNGLKIDVTEDMRLLGVDAPLDSLGLVMVLASFEADINDSFRTEIVLVDEHAMSLERSPFRTVSSLVDYACTLLVENGRSS